MSHKRRVGAEEIIKKISSVEKKDAGVKPLRHNGFERNGVEIAAEAKEIRQGGIALPLCRTSFTVSV